MEQQRNDGEVEPVDLSKLGREPSRPPINYDLVILRGLGKLLFLPAFLYSLIIVSYLMHDAKPYGFVIFFGLAIAAGIMARRSAHGKREIINKFVIYWTLGGLFLGLFLVILRWIVKHF